MSRIYQKLMAALLCAAIMALAPPHRSSGQENQKPAPAPRQAENDSPTAESSKAQPVSRGIATPSNQPEENTALASSGDGRPLHKSEIDGVRKSGGSASAKYEPARELTPEVFYRIVLDRHRIAISSQKQILKILEVHGNDPIRAMRDLQTHEAEKQQKFDMIFKKYRVSPEQYYRSSRGTEEQRERAEYLDSHPEIRDALANNSNQLRELEEKVWRRMTPLWASQAPPG